MRDDKYLAIVCDDHGTRVLDWQTIVGDHLGTEWVVSTVSGEDLALMIEALSLREAESRAGSTSEDRLTSDHKFQLELLNQADLVVFDSDLTPSLEDSDKQDVGFAKTLRNQMGDAVARQIRSYTSAGYIAVVNMLWGNYPGERVFDLTMTLGVGSHADLHISDAELSDSALWTGLSADGSYHPWSWPALAHGSKLVASSELAIGDLDAPVFSTLGIDKSRFAPRQLDLFGKVANPTFRDLTHTSLGFRYPTAVHDEAAVTRMAASVMRRWLARVVLAPQNVVTDAPHLLTRFSPVLREHEPDATAWALSVARSWEEIPNLEWLTEACAHPLEPFLDRRVYTIDLVRDMLAEAESSYNDAPELNFAEDLSQFVDINDGSDFETDLPGPYYRRFVAEIDTVDYEPAPRLLQ